MSRAFEGLVLDHGENSQASAVECQSCRTVTINAAWWTAHELKRETALLDLGPHSGIPGLPVPRSINAVAREEPELLGAEGRPGDLQEH